MSAAKNLVRKVPGANAALGRADQLIQQRVAAAVQGMESRLAFLEQRYADDAAWSANEIRRIAPQVAALESRIEEIRERLETAPSGDDERQTAARDILDSVRREHEQIRARFAGMSQYEERLRRLEGAGENP
ncbi:hypothetical protein BH24ACT9_BH24ACT9_09170 [soil metagenome]